jgi:uncharacterized protein
MRIPPPLLAYLRSRFALDWNGIHGVAHWSRVARIGERLAEETGARMDVVRLFAFFHDSCRESDGWDREHGPRAALLVEALHESHFQLDRSGLGLLIEACHGHTNREFHDDATVQTCWDADRLDLGRVGIYPDPDRLGTAPAKRREVIEWAYAWSVGERRGS